MVVAVVVAVVVVVVVAVVVVVVGVVVVVVVGVADWATEFVGDGAIVVVELVLVEVGAANGVHCA